MVRRARKGIRVFKEFGAKQVLRVPKVKPALAGHKACKARGV